MWDKLRKQVQVELNQLHSLLATHRALLEKRAEAAPDTTELAALAALLHSFYTGVENIFKRIAVEIDGAAPAGEFWHSQLLDGMMKMTRLRNPVISPALRARLKEYLEFRHVFRQAYIFQLRWEKMQPLVIDCDETFRQFETELNSFLGEAG